jgi:thiamine pyrophosphate-dependent acetolactate synthase large subunit-like protein
LRTGGQILADALVRNGVERAFCVSGEYYLAALDALYQSPVAVRVLREPFFPKLSKHLIGKTLPRHY